MDSTKDRIIAILNETFSVALASVEDDNVPIGELDLDSMELVEFALRLEDQFNIEIPDDQMTATMTIGQIVETVERLKG